MSDQAAAQHVDHDSSFIGTLKSLIVAFVLAMTFRGFIVEGFVIPTGSMAPTLLGQHKRLHAAETGWDFAVGYDPRLRNTNLDRVADPMLGHEHPGSGTSLRQARTRMGDRILVLKSIYPFAEPSRFDVVVFKNPTNPNGPDGNYIKRLIGLPGESIWLADGDVFAGLADRPDDYEAYEIQRKPEYIQRAVWQPVHNSDYLPMDPGGMDSAYKGVPWQGDGWQTNDRRSYRCDESGPTVLRWEHDIRSIDDWNFYNSLTLPITHARMRRLFQVHDLRVAAAVVPDSAGLDMTFQIEARGYAYEFIVAGGNALVRMRPLPDEQGESDPPWSGSALTPIDELAAGQPTNVEFWHVDQSMAIFINGKRVAYHEYDWRPVQRLKNAASRDEPAERLASLSPQGPLLITWKFDGSPSTLHRVQLDRDLYYRPDKLNEQVNKNPVHIGFEDIVFAGNHAFGCHPANLAILGPEHFFMLGDNSAASSDSRLWGNPHPLVAAQIDESPFVVNRKLLIGKAWAVYFPSPHSVSDEGKSVIPDFGRWRFIR